jgi:predicted ABC-type ATPase
MPQFLVVAGPNGAGKSTFSTQFSRPGALIFDPDAEKFKIEKQYPDISQESLESELTRKYHTFEVRAVSSKLHLTVETNLRNNFLAERAQFFRENDYETRLIYMFLPDVETSMDRVNLRVNKKGHFVDAESIRTNFVKGLENLKMIARQFDQLMLISAANDLALKTQPQLLLTVERGLVKQKAMIMPDWCDELVRDIEQLAIGQAFSKGRGKD